MAGDNNLLRFETKMKRNKKVMNACSQLRNSYPAVNAGNHHFPSGILSSYIPLAEHGSHKVTNSNRKLQDLVRWSQGRRIIIGFTFIYMNWHNWHLLEDASGRK